MSSSNAGWCGRRPALKAVDYDTRLLSKADIIARLVGRKRKVLDCGCGGGGEIARVLKEDNGCDVVGIDVDADRLDQAAPYLASAIVGDLEREELWGNLPEMDVVVFSDVLEHLRLPESALSRAVHYTRPEAIVVSLPNVAYYDVRLRLLKGYWEYQDGGILDRTHLRFYTLHSARAFFQGALQPHSILYAFQYVPYVNLSWPKSWIFGWCQRRWPTAFAIGFVFRLQVR